MRETLKEIAGRGIARANPQCRFDRCLFILAHMRCGSTALSNILCSRPDVSGYGECHIRYDSEQALGRLVLNQARAGGWKPRADVLFDKILHNRLDGSPPTTFFDARAIFLVRDPANTIRSICTLFATLPENRRAEYDAPDKAAAYYVKRLGWLRDAWQRFPPNRRFGLTHAELLADPEQALGGISARFAVTPPLKNHYRSLPASRRGGGGDPTRSGRLNRIERKEQLDHVLPIPDVDQAIWTAALAAYEAIKAEFAAAPQQVSAGSHLAVKGAAKAR